MGQPLRAATPPLRRRLRLPQRRRQGGRARSTSTARAGATTERDFGVGYYAAPPARPTASTSREARLRAVRRRPAAAARRHDPQHHARARRRCRGSSTGTSTRTTRPTAHIAGSARRAGAPAAQTLSVAQQAGEQGDTRPLSIFAAALRGPVDGFETSVDDVLRRRQRGRAPAEVAADQLAARSPRRRRRARATRRCSPSARRCASRPGAVGDAPLRLRHGAPGADPGARGASTAGARDPLARERAPLGRAGCRRRTSAPAERWVARELQWDAYLLRARHRSTRRTAAHHTITQGGYYQYALGANLGYAQLAALPAADRLHGARARARDPALLDPAAAARPRGEMPVRQRPAVHALRPRHLQRPRLLAAAGGRRVRARHARHRSSSTSRCRSTTAAARRARGSTSRSPSATRSRCAARTAATSMGATGDWSDFSTELPER